MTFEGNSAVESSPMQTQIDTLMKNIATIDNVFGQLRDRLEPVLRSPDPICSPEPKEEETVTSPLERQLLVINMKLHEHISNIQFTLNRLTL